MRTRRARGGAETETRRSRDRTKAKQSRDGAKAEARLNQENPAEFLAMNVNKRSWNSLAERAPL